MHHSSGQYDRRVGFERFDSSARNALNEPVGEWRLVGETFAARADVSDGEKLQAGRESSALVSRFTVRSSRLTRSLSTADRLVLRGSWSMAGLLISGEIWDIDGIKEVAGETNRELEITAVTLREG